MGDRALGNELREIGAAFGLAGAFRGAVRHGRGHIHDTFVARYEREGSGERYVHQRLNTEVFRDPEALMGNVARVIDHLGRKLAGAPDAERRHLRLVRARDGRPFHVDAAGRCWRTTRYVEGTRTLEWLGSPAEAREAGRAFGEFAAQLDDLPPPRLVDTIPHFHDLARRFAALESAAGADRVARAASVARELDAARELVRRVEDALGALGPLPRRLVHNDCKVDNLLFDGDRDSATALCVVDLDTVMDGSLLCDFGELVRSGACPAAEDERELSRVDVDLELVEALARGYLEGAGPLPAEIEVAALPLAGVALALENGIRFLTDHLDGDRYFRVAREAHNLDRARAQLRLADRLWEERDPTRRAVERAAQRAGSSSSRV